MLISIFSNRAFQESFSTLKPGFPWVTRLSSAGLVYVHFGQEIIAQVLNMPVDSELVQETYKRVYEGFIEEIVSFKKIHVRIVF